MNNELPLNGIFLSTPWDLITSRKGDPLGFQGIANQIAAEIAPGLSGRNIDARWLTLLCRGLSKFNAYGKDDPYKIFSQWERGIIKRAIMLESTEGRQLPGIRSVDSWPQQYRYYGPYGSYKKMLVNIGCLEEDGWTLTQTGKILSKTIKDEISPKFGNPVNVENCIQPNDIKKIKKWLPLTFEASITSSERKVLAPIVFGACKEGLIRRNTFQWMNKKRTFWHQKKEGIPGSLCEAFQQFTCSCFALIKEVSCSLSIAPAKQEFSTCQNWKNVIKGAEKIIELKEAIPSQSWNHLVKLTTIIVKSKNPNPKIILDHHLSSSGSGKKWITSMGGKYESLVSEREKMRRGYSFRLGNIWRLGHQLIPNEGPRNYPWSLNDVEEMNED